MNETEQIAQRVAAERTIDAVQEVGRTFLGPDGIKVYTCIVLARALQFYVKTGMKVNSAYTPKNMIAKARELLGPDHRIKARGYLHAANELQKLADELAPVARAKGEIK